MGRGNKKLPKPVPYQRPKNILHERGVPATVSRLREKVKVYELFRNGVRSQPPLEIKATEDGYEDYDPLFELS